VELEDDPDTPIVQKSERGGADRRTAAAAEQQDQAHAPGQDHEGRLSV